MPCYHSSLGSRIRSWLRDYDRIQDVAVILIYIQIGCALVGSLGALFNGVLLINLVIALFALVAIESSSQSLGRTYAVLLFCAIILDISWLILFSGSIWNFAPAEYGTFIVFSLRLALSMQIIGFSVRFLSSFLWIQMYRLGPGSIDSTAYHEVDFDVRSSFLNPATHEIARENSNSEEFIGGSIYDPAYFSSLFEDSQDNGYLRKSSVDGPRRLRLLGDVDTYFKGTWLIRLFVYFSTSYYRSCL
ncbi:uncharacterized protein LOC109850281 isoform X2 [Asparagus officinalis]|uniref:uncharacterized protein LOC109850281 isoform X2 n=1 Tax=Asparagus officinalis TaxID=4686 RepID=UPI00098DEB2A|nr:uncharacterized protein LOC109850281 isoform X2 [Asparagus officinalis]